MSRRAWRISGEFVRTTIPSQTSTLHEAMKKPSPSTSTMQTRQEPAKLRSGW